MLKLYFFPLEFDRVVKGDLKGAELQKVMEDYNKQVHRTKWPHGESDVIHECPNVRGFGEKLNSKWSIFQRKTPVVQGVCGWVVTLGD